MKAVDQTTARAIAKAAQAYGVTVVLDKTNGMVLLLVGLAKDTWDGAVVCYWTADHARNVARGLLSGADRLDAQAQEIGGGDDVSQ